MQTAVIWDMDGVLVGSHERLTAFIAQHESQGIPVEWNRWYAGLGEHDPRPEFIALARIAQGAGHVNIIISGRPERTRPTTERWLDLHLPNAWGHLALWDDEQHSFLASKQVNLDRLVGEYECVLALDDEECWAELYRAYGIPTIHVENSGCSTLVMEIDQQIAWLDSTGRLASAAADRWTP